MGNNILAHTSLAFHLLHSMPQCNRGHRSVGVCRDRFMAYFSSDFEGHPEKNAQTTAKIPTSGIQPACERKGAADQRDGAPCVLRALRPFRFIHTPTNDSLNCSGAFMLFMKEFISNWTAGKRQNDLLTIISTKCLQNTGWSQSFTRIFLHENTHACALQVYMKLTIERCRKVIFKSKPAKPMWTPTQTKWPNCSSGSQRLCGFRMQHWATSEAW